MWIRNSNTATDRLSHPDLDEDVSFNDDGKARVTEDAGRTLIEAFPTIEEVSDEDASADGTDDTNDDGDAEVTA